MSTAKKIWLFTAVSLILIGSLVFATAMAVNRWDFSKLSTVRFVTNTYSVSESFSDISMEIETADIVFAPSDDEKCKVVCYEPEKTAHSVSVRDGSLIIGANDERKWYDFICISLGSPKITVYLPQSEYSALVIKGTTGSIEIPDSFGFDRIDISISTGDVSTFASASGDVVIKATTGDIKADGITARSLDLTVTTGGIYVSDVHCAENLRIHTSTGDAKLIDVSCGDLITRGTTGDVSLKNVIAAGKISVDRSTGNVTLIASDASEIFVQTSTGDVTGNLLSDKVFIARSATGTVDVPKSVTGGRCEISTSTGDIRIKVKP